MTHKYIDIVRLAPDQAQLMYLLLGDYEEGEYLDDENLETATEIKDVDGDMYQG